MDTHWRREQIDMTPFQESVNVNLFFPRGNRGEILEKILQTLVGGTAVITVTGEEGAGKTMIARMVEKKLPAEYSCAYLPDHIESFDDVVRVIALKLEILSADQPESTAALLAEIENELQLREGRLVVIIDQAERMYLATIERLRKLLDRLNTEKIVLQLVFVGRRSLLENLKQLALCNFDDVGEQHFRIHALGLSETYAYLNYCAQKASPSRGRSVFSPDAAKKIYNMALGNMKMVNMLAAKSLESADLQASFMVLLDNVNDEKSEDISASGKTAALVSKLPKAWWLSGGAILALLVIAVMLFTGEEEKLTERPNDSKANTEATTETTTEAVAEPEAAVEPASEEPATEPASLSQNSEEQKKDEGRVKLGSAEVDEVDAGRKSSAKKQSAGAVTEVDKQQETVGERGKLSNRQQNVPGSRNEQVPATAVEPVAPEVMEEPIERQQQDSVQVVTDDNQKESITAKLVKVEPLEILQEREPVRDDSKAMEKGGDLPKREMARQRVPTVISPAPGEQQKNGLTPAVQDNNNKQLSDKKQEEMAASVAQQENDVSPEPLESQKTKADSHIRQNGVEENRDSEKQVILADGKKKLPDQRSSITTPKSIFKIAPVKLYATTQYPTAQLKENEKKNNAENGADSSDLYSNRLAAGGRWLALGETERFSLQLMALSAELAEESLRQRLTRQQYRNAAENLYIIKSEDGAKVFLYYGDFPDRETARRAEKALPPLLRRHDPFTVSLQNVGKKIAADQQ